MKIKLFWTEMAPLMARKGDPKFLTVDISGMTPADADIVLDEALKNARYFDRDHGSLYHERYLLEHTEPDLNTITLKDLEYLEAPLIERLPNKTYFFSFSKLDVERIISRRPGENVLGIVLEDLALIINRGYCYKFNVPLPDIEFVHSISYRHPPRIVQLIAGIHTTNETWPEKHVTNMQTQFNKHKEALLKLWRLNDG